MWSLNLGMVTVIGFTVNPRLSSGILQNREGVESKIEILYIHMFTCSCAPRKQHVFRNVRNHIQHTKIFCICIEFCMASSSRNLRSSFLRWSVTHGFGGYTQSCQSPYLTTLPGQPYGLEHHSTAGGQPTGPTGTPTYTAFAA